MVVGDQDPGGGHEVTARGSTATTQVPGSRAAAEQARPNSAARSAIAARPRPVPRLSRRVGRPIPSSATSSRNLASSSVNDTALYTDHNDRGQARETLAEALKIYQEINVPTPAEMQVMRSAMD
jgi:hypothetical protein